MQLLDKNIVMILNKSWIPVAVTSVRRAIVSLCSETNGKHPVLAIDMEVVTDENGEQTLVYANPIPWEKWIELEIRPGDLYVQSAHQKIRVPTVLVASNFNKLVVKKPRLSKSSVASRDSETCQYSGRKLSRSEYSLDHILPKSRGGKDTFLNLVLCDKKINMAKGDKTPEEAGLTLIRQPKIPPTTPVVITMDDVKHESWKHFLVR